MMAFLPEGHLFLLLPRSFSQCCPPKRCFRGRKAVFRSLVHQKGVFVDGRQFFAVLSTKCVFSWTEGSFSQSYPPKRCFRGRKAVFRSFVHQMGIFVDGRQFFAVLSTKRVFSWTEGSFSQCCPPKRCFRGRKLRFSAKKRLVQNHGSALFLMFCADSLSAAYLQLICGLFAVNLRLFCSLIMLAMPRKQQQMPR